MIEDKSTIESIDIAKFFFSIMIVFLHSGICSELDENVGYWIEKGVLRLAVPFFFTVSGYLFGTKIVDGKVKEKVKKYCKKLIIPLIVFELINIVLEVLCSILQGESYSYIFLKIIRSIVAYPYGALWYIQASIIGMLLLYIFMRRNKFIHAILCFNVFYIFALLCNSYYFIVEENIIGKMVYQYLHYFVSARNGLFVGALFLGIGVYISKYNTKNLSRYIFLYCLFFYTIYICEAYYLKDKVSIDDGSLQISLVLLIPVLVLCIRCWSLDISQKYSLLLRNMSIGIYFLHRPILYIIILYQYFSKRELSGTISFVITTFCAVSICLLIMKTENKSIKRIFMWD